AEDELLKAQSAEQDKQWQALLEISAEDEAKKEALRKQKQAAAQKAKFVETQIARPPVELSPQEVMMRRRVAEITRRSDERQAREQAELEQAALQRQAKEQAAKQRQARELAEQEEPEQEEPDSEQEERDSSDCDSTSTEVPEISES
ncbi:unnamed protein product, partial [Polarella glacialis]